MDSFLSSSIPVHFYDTDRHLILCGVRGFADRSTKHARTVTCPTCVELLADRRAAVHNVPIPYAADPHRGGLA